MRTLAMALNPRRALVSTANSCKCRDITFEQWSTMTRPPISPQPSELNRTGASVNHNEHADKDSRTHMDGFISEMLSAQCYDNSISCALSSKNYTPRSSRRLVRQRKTTKRKAYLPFAPLREHTEIRLGDYTPHAQGRPVCTCAGSSS